MPEVDDSPGRPRGDRRGSRSHSHGSFVAEPDGIGGSVWAGRAITVGEGAGTGVSVI